MKYTGLLPRLAWVAIAVLIPLLPTQMAAIFRGGSTIALVSPALALALLLSYVHFFVLDECKGKAASIVKGILIGLCFLLYLAAGALASFDAVMSAGGLYFGSVFETAYVACWFPASVITLYLDKKCADEQWGYAFCSFLPMMVFAVSYCASLILAAFAYLWSPLGVTVPTAIGLVLFGALLVLFIAGWISEYKPNRKPKAGRGSPAGKPSDTVQVK